MRLLATLTLFLIQATVTLAQGRFLETDALMVCQRALQQASPFPKTTLVPIVRAAPPVFDDAMQEDTWRFFWGNKSAMVSWRKRTGEVESRNAACVINRRTGKLTLLALDGYRIQLLNQPPPHKTPSIGLPPLKPIE